MLLTFVEAYNPVALASLSDNTGDTDAGVGVILTVTLSDVFENCDILDIMISLAKDSLCSSLLID